MGGCALILCRAQGIEAYSFVECGVELGLWKSYRDRPALFSAITFFSPIPYQWEPYSPVPKMERITRLFPEAERLYSRALDADVGGYRLATLLGFNETPIWFWQRYREIQPAPSLGLESLYGPGDLLKILEARVYAWAAFSGRIGWGAAAGLRESIDNEVRLNSYGRYAYLYKRRRGR